MLLTRRHKMKISTLTQKTKSNFVSIRKSNHLKYSFSQIHQTITSFFTTAKVILQLLRHQSKLFASDPNYDPPPPIKKMFQKSHYAFVTVSLGGNQDKDVNADTCTNPEDLLDQSGKGDKQSIDQQRPNYFSNEVKKARFQPEVLKFKDQPNETPLFPQKGRSPVSLLNRALSSTVQKTYH